MTKVLLLSASFGDGHRQVANALNDAFLERGVNVQVVDCFQETNQHVAKTNERLYEFITRYLPFLYGATYRLTARWSTRNLLWKILSLNSSKALQRTVQDFQPDAILQLFPDHASERVRKQNGKPFLGVVITDFSVHSHWFHAGVDAYFIAHSGLREEMQRFLTPQTEVIDSGIPVRRQFQDASQCIPPQEDAVGISSEHQPSFSVPEQQPYILIATGGRGLLPDLQELTDTLLRRFPEAHIYVLCGRNANMLKQVEEKSSEEPRLHGLPYIQYIAPWFQNATLAVVKSGGITVSECLCMQCPMILYRPQSGQEADNAWFLQRIGAGQVARNVAHLDSILKAENFRKKLSDMASACASGARPRAVETIVEYVLGRTRGQTTTHEQ